MPAMDEGGIREALRRLGVPHHEIGEAIGASRDSATRLMNEQRPRRIRVDERQPLLRLIAKYERDAGESEVVRNLEDFDVEFEAGLVQAYVSVEVLPTYGGMGGGGTADDMRRRALLPRTLVEDELHAKPEDILVIDCRGDSMEPKFMQGDQIVIDRRDCNPVQPGPFALRDGDYYVVKYVEKVGAKLRLFSPNSIFTETLADPDTVEIMGRPVWFARRV